MSDNWANFFAKHKKPGWQRWEMEAFDRPNSCETDKHQTKRSAAQQQALENEKQQLLEQARQEGFAQGQKAGYEEGKQKGYSDGFKKGQEEGYSAALTEGQKATKAQVERLQQIISNYSKALEQLEEEIGQQFIGLAIDIAQEILHTTIELHPEVIQHLIDEVVALETDPQALLTLHCNPSDIEEIEAHLSAQHSEMKWKLLADANIQPGGCVVSSPFGEIDARLKTRWQRLVQTLGHPIKWLSK